MSNTSSRLFQNYDKRIALVVSLDPITAPDSPDLGQFRQIRYFESPGFVVRQVKVELVQLVHCHGLHVQTK